MKLKTLKIHNIASIEDAYIDFEGPELGTQDIFIICGPTGSGKTTILDAICLALFDNTPRIENTGGKYKINEYDDTDKKSDLDNVKSVLHLVRKNAVEASVVLTFEADNRAYTATWRVYRTGQYIKGKENKTFAKLSLEDKVSRGLKKEWTLTDDKGESVEKDVKNTIVEIIKMTFQQFCKTTMLAQGEFTKFLSSSPDDKAQILEKLVGTEKFAQVGAVINRTANDLKRDLEVLEKELENITFLSNDEREAKLKQIEDIAAQVASISAQKSLIEQKIKWIDDTNKCAQDIAEAQSRYQETQQALDADEVKSKIQKLALWDKTHDVRQALTCLDECASSEQRIDIEQSRLDGIYDQAVAGISYLLDKIKRIKTEIENLNASIAAQSAYEQMFANANLICSKHSDILRHKKSVDDDTITLQELADTLDNLKQQRSNIETQKQEVEAQINTIEDSIANLKNNLSELGADTIDKESESLNNHISLITNAENAINNYEDAQKALADKQQKAKDAEAQIQPLQQAVDQLLAQYEVRVSAAKESKALYDKTLASVSDHAKALRHNLKAGDACPVCGHIIDMLVSDEELANALRPLEEKHKADESAATQSLETLNNAKVKLLEAQTKADTLAEDIAEAESRIKALAESLRSVRDSLDISEAKDLRPTLDQLRKQDEAALDSIKRRQHEIKGVRKAIEEAEGKIKSMRTKQLKNIDKKLTEIIAQIEQATAQKSKLSGKIDSSNRTIETLNKEINKLINPEWKPVNVDEYYGELKEAADKFNELKGNRDTKEVELIQLTQQHSLIESSMEVIDRLFPAWAARSDAEPRELPNLGTVWTDLRAKAELLAKDIEATKKAKEAAATQVDDFVGNHPEINIADVKALLTINANEIAEMRSAVNTLRDAASKAEAVLTEAKKRAASLAESPLEEDDTKETLTEALNTLTQSITAQSESKGRLVHELETDEQNRKLQGKKREDLEQKRDEYAQWETLNKYLGSTDGKLFRNVAQSFILSELLAKANVYLSNISTRYELFCHPGTFTIMMRDGYQGGVERSTNTLSGGESFIISLSLALGLSSMQNVDFEVDTLFIDEGFGTLSPEYLDPVITALKRLNETYGRRVGIISHVDTLKQRIPASIEVSKQGTSSSKVTVNLN